MQSPYEPSQGEIEKLGPEAPTGEEKRRQVLFHLVWVTVAASLGYRLLVAGHLEQTSLMFIGLPAVLAILTACIPPTKSATGLICKMMMFFLSLLGILAVEGFICILMAAPLFLVVGVIVGLITDSVKKRNRKRGNQVRCCVIGALTVMSLEGVNDALSFEREETVVRSLEVPLTHDEVLEALARGPELVGVAPPPFLQLGFPQVQEMDGGGVAVGDEWRIRFGGGEGVPGDMRAELVERTENRLRYVCTDDGSHIAHWLDWTEAVWTVTERAEGGCRVELAIGYRRLLDPAWYFKPVQRYGVGKAAEFFLAQTLKGEGGEPGTVD